MHVCGILFFEVSGGLIKETEVLYGGYLQGQYPCKAGVARRDRKGQLKRYVIFREDCLKCRTSTVGREVIANIEVYLRSPMP